MSGDATRGTPELLLERYRLGEVSAEEQRLIDARLRSEAGLRERLDGLEASDAAIRAAETAVLGARVRGRLAAGQAVGGARFRLSPLPVLLAVAALLAVALLPILPPGPAQEETRLKGAAPSGLALYRKTASGSEPLRDGASARKGDEIQIGYRATDRRYGAILSVDGRGSVTQHLPAEGGTAAALVTGRSVLLDFAYQLDDAPRFERFYFVTADAPFDIARVREALVAAASSRLELPKGQEHSLFTLLKENQP